MIIIRGTWYDGKRSAQTEVVLKVYDTDALQVERIDNGEILRRRKSFDLRVSDRLADTPRLLSFPDGAVLETDDNAGVDRILEKIRRDHWSLWVHLIESRKRYVLTAFLIVLLIGAGTVKFGFPAAARWVAVVLPDSIYDLADRQTLAFLDKALFSDSTLPPATEERVRGHLRAVIATHPDLGLELQFRKGGKLGPNAFALPGGTIVFTDEMVQMAGHDEELLAVMAHEIGHVVHRHGMRRMVQDSMLSFAILALTGDASGVSELFLGLPVVLTELAYSRAFEREADRYALDYLLAHGVPPERFADILTRIDQQHKVQASDQGDGEGWTGYLATHPPTPERVKLFREAGAAE